MNRDLRIDFLRFLGLSLVIIAHVQAPFTLTQIRSFDVPLMVFVSGLTASMKPITNYGHYIWKRTKRLVIPVWLYLIVYLSVFYFAQSFLLPEKYLTWRMIGRSFLLLDDSIGYVWIIRIFLLMMLITPPIVALSHRIKKDYIFLGFILSVLLSNQVVYQVSLIIGNIFIKEIIEDFLIYGLAYAVPFALGIRLKDANKKLLLLYSMFLGIVLALLFVNCIMRGNDPIGVSSGYKFPPRPYFIAYGSLVSVLLWATRNCWGKMSNNRLASFIGQNTIWIYLWHMPFALFATVYMHNWLMKYVFVYGMALMLFCIQYLIVKKINNKTLNKYLLG